MVSCKATLFSLKSQTLKFKGVKKKDRKTKQRRRICPATVMVLNFIPVNEPCVRAIY
jgi:hypothetical protein